MNYENIKEALKIARPLMSDAMALNSIKMYPTWDSVLVLEMTQEDIEKGYDRYQYNGKLYRLAQPHTPQAG